jgi:hypothetical protein
MPFKEAYLLHEGSNAIRGEYQRNKMDIGISRNREELVKYST